MYWPPKVRLEREIQEGSGSDNRETYGTSSIKMHAKLNLLNTTGQTVRLMSVLQSLYEASLLYILPPLSPLFSMPLI